MKNILILLSLTIFMVSCASNSSSNNRTKNIEVSKNAKLTLADKNSDEKVICKQVKKTGSNRITTVCNSQSEIDGRRDSTQRELQKRIGRGGPSGTGRGN
jgi:hypothetical protein